MSRFLNKQYQTLKAYTPGEQPRNMQYIKLNTNESPYPPAPSVVAAMNGEQVELLRLYSDPTAKELKEKLAALYGVQPENVFVSNGSDEVLNFAFMAFGGQGVVFPEISYGFYEVYAELYRLDYEKIPLEADFSLDYKMYCGRNKMVVIANPNAPTGISLSSSQIEEIVKSNPDNVVIIDEAYVDFGGESVVPLIKKYDNLLVTQTFSKSRSMAGARLGFGVGSSALIQDLNTIKYSTNPYNINKMTMSAGIGVLKDEKYTINNCKEIIKSREFTLKELKRLGFVCTDSLANFVFAKYPEIGGENLYLSLKNEGVLVRHFGNERICDYNRITIGTKAQMKILISKIEKILEEKK